MKKIVFVCPNEHTVNVLVLDQDYLIQNMGSLLRGNSGMEKDAQFVVLARSLTNYEVQNEHFEDFKKLIVRENPQVINFDSQINQEITIRLTERSAVSINPILIPLDKINPNKPAYESVIVEKHNTGYIGKYVEKEYTPDKSVENKENLIGVIVNGVYVINGGTISKQKNIDEGRTMWQFGTLNQGEKSCW